MVHCKRCGAQCVPQGCTTGYGENAKGDKLCFACCADDDRASMIKDGRWTGYLTRKDGAWTVSNWPESLTFPTTGVKVGTHNIARTRRDAWFAGPDGFAWHAVSYGEWSDIAHCRRTRERIKSRPGSAVQS